MAIRTSGTPARRENLAFASNKGPDILKFVMQLVEHYNLDPATNEDYRRFLISEGAITEDWKPGMPIKPESECT